VLVFANTYTDGGHRPAIKGVLWLPIWIANLVGQSFL
jgi:hypothetical protein